MYGQYEVGTWTYLHKGQGGRCNPILSILIMLKTILDKKVFNPCTHALHEREQAPYAFSVYAFPLLMKPSLDVRSVNCANDTAFVYFFQIGSLNH